MSKKEKKNFIRILIALSMFSIILIIDKTINLETLVSGQFGWLLPFVLYLVVYIIIGYDVLLRAFRNILHGQIFDENFLMCIATLGAFSLAIYLGSTGKAIEGFDEACAVLLFYQVGEFFQNYATRKSRKSISALMDIRPDYANLKKDQIIEKVDPTCVKVKDIIVINPGEKIPLDGVILKGSSTLDTKALTGESLPRDVHVNDDVISGCVNLTSQIEVEVRKEFYDSTVSKILDLVENASSQKSKAENFITKFAKYYTPIVVCIALALAILPSVITKEWSVWVYRALSFLVVSCPCALVISIPLSFFAGIGASSRYGILIKGSNYLEKLNQANIFVFDKTGTLTKGNFVVTKITPIERKEEILSLAAIAEQNSNHPIAKSIINAYHQDLENDYILTNIAGQGIMAKKGNQVIFCGNEKLMIEKGIDFTKEKALGTIIYVAKNDEFIGSILIEDEIKEETKDVISELNKMNCKTIMLTGDNDEIAQKVATEVGLTGYKASLLPQNKVEEVEELLNSKKDKEVLCFVGDGINDAPVLARSDIGIAMGGVGSDVAIEAADVVLMSDDITSIAKAIQVSHYTNFILKENVTFTLLIKIGVLVLTLFGLTNMWMGVFADVGVTLIAICNSMRILYKKS